MSVSGPPPPDRVLPGPLDGLGAEDITPGTCFGAGRAAGTRVDGSPGVRVSGPFRRNKMLLVPRPGGFGPSAEVWLYCLTSNRKQGRGNEVWRGSGVWGAVGGG